MGRQDWTGGTPIASRESGVHNGLWYPAIEIYSESDGPHGTAQQRFILHDLGAGPAKAKRIQGVS